MRIKIILTLCILFPGCNFVEKKIDSVINEHFNKKRLRRLCASSTMRLYDLQKRIQKTQNTDSLFFLSPTEINFLKKHEDSFIHFFQDGDTPINGERLFEVESFLSKELSGISKVFNDCESFSNKNFKCKRLEGHQIVNCFQQSTELFTLSKIIKSDAIDLFPQEESKKINDKINTIKNYLKNLEK